MFEEIPIEIITKIFKYLTIYDAFYLGLTNKLLNKIYLHYKKEIFWNFDRNKEFVYSYLIKRNMKIINSSFNFLNFNLKFNKNILIIEYECYDGGSKQILYKKKVVKENKSLIKYYFNNFLKTTIIGFKYPKDYQYNYCYFISLKSLKLFVETVLNKKDVKNNNFNNILLDFLETLCLGYIWINTYKIYLYIDDIIDDNLLIILNRHTLLKNHIIIIKKDDLIKDFNYKNPYHILKLHNYCIFDKLDYFYYYHLYNLIEIEKQLNDKNTSSEDKS